MEEKKSIKISLKTYLLSMFFMMLIIGFLLGYIMHVSKSIQAKLNVITEHIAEQKAAEEVVEDEVEETEEVENTVTEENENVVEGNVVTEENVEDANTNTVDIATEENNESEFSDEDIKKALDSYLNIFVGHGSPAGILNSLDLMSFRESQNYELGEDNYKVTDIPYSLFEEKIEEHTTLENFKTINEGNKFVEVEFKEVDGNVAYYDGGWSGTEYEVHSIAKKEDSLTATHDAEILRTEGERKVIENVEFSVENNNGKCVISYCK